MAVKHPSWTTAFFFASLSATLFVHQSFHPRHNRHNIMFPHVCDCYCHHKDFSLQSVNQWHQTLVFSHAAWTADVEGLGSVKWFLTISGKSLFLWWLGKVICHQLNMKGTRIIIWKWVENKHFCPHVWKFVCQQPVSLWKLLSAHCFQAQVNLKFWWHETGGNPLFEILKRCSLSHCHQIHFFDRTQESHTSWRRRAKVVVLIFESGGKLILRNFWCQVWHAWWVTPLVCPRGGGTSPPLCWINHCHY